MNKPHKHAEVIKAWADGAPVQFKGQNGKWQDIAAPTWGEAYEYRVKPQPETLFVRVARHKDGSLIAYAAPERSSPHLANDRWATTETMQWASDDIPQVHGERP